MPRPKSGALSNVRCVDVRDPVLSENSIGRFVRPPADSGSVRAHGCSERHRRSPDSQTAESSGRHLDEVVEQLYDVVQTTRQNDGGDLYFDASGAPVATIM